MSISEEHLFAKRLLRHYPQHEVAALPLVEKLLRYVREGHTAMPLDGADFPLLMHSPFRCTETHLYLQKHWFFETKILERLQLLPKGPYSRGATQQEAVENGLKFPLSLLTGGPGTGKTYTAALLANAFLEAFPQKSRILLAAPTGKAASHLEKSLGASLKGKCAIRSGTLHSLLYKELDADLILVDECSMIDLGLFSRLLQSVPQEAHLVCIGDPYQLPSVEGGSIFADLVDSCFLPTVCLNVCLRTENTTILDLAKRIREGDPEAFSCLQKENFHLDSPEKFARELHLAIEGKFPTASSSPPSPEELFPFLQNFRILSCTRQGPFGVDSINEIILSHLLEISQGWLPIPILLTRNDSTLGLYNGEVGFLLKNLSCPSGEEDTILFFDAAQTPKFYPPHAVPLFEYAYCLSVHKSQGSEYQEILLLVTEGSENFGREVLYTAVTRAKERLSFDAVSDVLERAITTSGRRHSGILFRLANLRPLA